MTWWAMQTCVVTAAMAVILTLTSPWLRKAPAAMHLLWMLVLVRFVMPPLVEWPWPLPMRDAQQAAVSQIEMDESPLLPFWRQSDSALPTVRESSSETAPVNPARYLPPWSPTQWLIALWASSIGLMATLQLVRLVRMHRMFRHNMAAPGWMQEAVDSLALNLRVHAPYVEVSPHLGVPVYWNLERPRLVVPQRLVDSLPREGWNSIFLHELAHHKRHDHWVGWLELIAGCVWWWNPVFWYARRRLREAAEMACDAWVVSELPEHRRVYADALLHVFESVSRRADRRLAWSMSADLRLGFERRLRMIYANTGSRSASRMALVAAIVLFVAVTPVWSVDEPAPPDAAPDAASAEPTAPSETAPAASPEVMTMNIVADAPPKEPGPMETVLNEASVSIEFENEHIFRIANFLSDYAEFNIVLDTRVIEPPPQGPDTIYDPEYVTDGMVPYIRLNNVRLRDALRALCRPLNLEFQAMSDFIWVSSPKNIEKETWPELPVDLDGKEQLTSGISIEFEDEHLSRILNFMAEYAGVNLMLDIRVVAPLPAPAQPVPPGEAVVPGAPVAPGVPPTQAPPATAPVRPSEPITAEVAAEKGYVTPGVVPYINLKNISLHHGLLALLRPMNLTYRVEEGFIWVSTAEKMAEESFK